jgi:transcription initiation factor TFIIB
MSYNKNEKGQTKKNKNNTLKAKANIKYSSENKKAKDTFKGRTKSKTISSKKELWKVFENDIKEQETETISSDASKSTFSSNSTSNSTCFQYDYCQICKCPLAITDEGFYACTNTSCGILYKDILDETAEWRYYGSSDNQTSDPTRCGMPTNPLLTESSYGCKIICNHKSTYEMRKIRRYTEWQSMPYKEKSQYEEFQRIKTMASNAGIPKLIIDDALRYHKKISEEKTFRALNRDGIIAASIYISGRLNNFPRTAKEIAAIFNLDNTSATKGCKNALMILSKLENTMENNEKTELCQTRPISFIERYCSKLNINKEITKVCQFVALKIEKNNIIPENTPHSVAAGVIYFVSQSCNLNISKRDIKNVSEISEVTINKCYKKLETLKTKLIPSVIVEKYSIYA